MTKRQYADGFRPQVLEGRRHISNASLMMTCRQYQAVRSCYSLLHGPPYPFSPSGRSSVKMQNGNNFNAGVSHLEIRGKRKPTDKPTTQTCLNLRELQRVL